MCFQTLAILARTEVWDLCCPRRLRGRRTGPRRTETWGQTRRWRGGVVNPHNEPATPDDPTFRPGPSGWACKGSHAALPNPVDSDGYRPEPAPCLRPLAGPTRARPSAAQPPRRLPELSPRRAQLNRRFLKRPVKPRATRTGSGFAARARAAARRCLDTCHAQICRRASG